MRTADPPDRAAEAAQSAATAADQGLVDGLGASHADPAHWTPTITLSVRDGEPTWQVYAYTGPGERAWVVLTWPVMSSTAIVTRTDPTPEFSWPAGFDNATVAGVATVLEQIDTIHGGREPGGGSADLLGEGSRITWCPVWDVDLLQASLAHADLPFTPTLDVFNQGWFLLIRPATVSFWLYAVSRLGRGRILTLEQARTTAARLLRAEAACLSLGDFAGLAHGHSSGLEVALVCSVEDDCELLVLRDPVTGNHVYLPHQPVLPAAAR